MLDSIVAETVPAGDTRVHLNTKVTSIEYTTAGVSVVTLDDTGVETQFNASVAISTLPLGVLRNDHRSLFSPPLDHSLAKILDGGTFVMSNLTRIYLQFPSVFWDDSVADWIAATDGAPGEFPEFRNMNHATRVPGSKILLLFVGTPSHQTSGCSRGCC